MLCNTADYFAVSHICARFDAFLHIACCVIRLIISLSVIFALVLMRSYTLDCYVE